MDIKMISEKTVELNLTTELINWASWVMRRTHFSLAPSQRQEGLLGFDTSVQANGTGILIQYKRAYVSGSHWTWHLNQTRMQDQHLRLQILESLGFPVLYAFPFFHTAHEIETNRWHLLKATFWYRPSQINSPGGSIGFHNVHYDSSTNRWWVTSEEEAELPPPESPRILLNFLESENNKNNLPRLLEAFNSVMTKDIKKSFLGFKRKDYLEGLFQGIVAIIEI